MHNTGFVCNTYMKISETNIYINISTHIYGVYVCVPVLLVVHVIPSV
jgi:hypothetical protein